MISLKLRPYGFLLVFWRTGGKPATHRGFSRSLAMWTLYLNHIENPLGGAGLFNLINLGWNTCKTTEFPSCCLTLHMHFSALEGIQMVSIKKNNQVFFFQTLTMEVPLSTKDWCLHCPIRKWRCDEGGPNLVITWLAGSSNQPSLTKYLFDMFFL